MGVVRATPGYREARGSVRRSMSSLWFLLDDVQARLKGGDLAGALAAARLIADPADDLVAALEWMEASLI